jgi:hypothetical protein
MDNYQNKLLEEKINKEEQMRLSHSTNRSNLFQKGGEQAIITPRGTVSLRQRPRSAAVRFLEEKVGNPEKEVPDDRPCTRELLYRGVSADGAGRAEYLKARRKYGIKARYGMPMTETHRVGSESASAVPAYSINCRKPIIQQSFYRMQGVDTHKGLPQ